MNPWLAFPKTPARRMIINPYAFPAAGGTPPALLGVVQVTQPGIGNITTSGVDTTGSSFIAVSVAGFFNATWTVSDNYGNTFTALTRRQDGGNFEAVQIFYCINPTVGTGHTFTATNVGFGEVGVAYFSGMSASAFLSEDGGANGSSSSTVTPTTGVTPSTANSVCIFSIGGLDNFYTNTLSVDSGYTLAILPLGHNIAVAVAYKVLTSSSLQKPTLTLSGSDNLACGIAAFSF